MTTPNIEKITTDEIKPKSEYKWIPWCFVAFFAVIALLDGIFVYIAITTQTGTVTENPYKKGLAYNAVLTKAKTQPELIEQATYNNGSLLWTLKNEQQIPITNAAVTAQIIRPVQSGHDFAITLNHEGNGLYKTALSLPLPGLWIAKLSSSWDQNTYQTTHKFIAP